jgi:translation initiation factor IF-3
VDPDGTQLGIKTLPEALQIARQLDLDLVEVAPEANPPVCRIMDFGKFKFDAAQRAKESRRKTTSSSIKEMKYRPKIGTGDFDTKTRQVAKFLTDGHKVKITIMFRGREMSHPELGRKILDHVAEQVGSVAKIESAPKVDGRNMIMVLAPDRRAQHTVAAPKRSAAPAAPALGEGETVTNGAAPSNGVAGPAAAGHLVEQTPVAVGAPGAGPAAPEAAEPASQPAAQPAQQAQVPAQVAAGPDTAVVEQES